MTFESSGAKAMALCVALGLHLVLAAAVFPPAPVEMEGASGTAEVRLGSSFQDLLEGGVTAPQPTKETQSALPLTETMQEPVRPQDTKLVHSPTLPIAEPVTPSHATRAVPLEPVVAAARLPAVLSADAVEQRIEAERPISESIQVPPADAEKAPDTANTEKASPRPRARPDTQPPRDAGARALERAAGNASVTAIAGATDGKMEGVATSRGQRGSRPDPGNAANDNYPGEVMRCIARAGRPSVNARGATVIAFNVDSSGRITGAAVASSSGNLLLDRAAKLTIRNAGPCPAPPPNARTRFRVRVEGR